VLAGLKKLMDSGAIKPTVYETEYRGLESVLQALKDLAARKVWGKAVILLDDQEQKSRL
jgi:NADPH2:quinone reductase